MNVVLTYVSEFPVNSFMFSLFYNIQYPLFIRYYIILRVTDKPSQTTNNLLLFHRNNILVIRLAQYFAIVVRRRCLQLLTNNIERLIQIPTTLYDHFIPTPVTGISDRVTA